MCDNCDERARKLRAIALDFRQLATRSSGGTLITMMMNSAFELEALADGLPERCANGGCVSKGCETSRALRAGTLMPGGRP